MCPFVSDCIHLAYVFKVHPRCGEYQCFTPFLWLNEMLHCVKTYTTCSQFSLPEIVMFCRVTLNIELVETEPLLQGD